MIKNALRGPHERQRMIVAPLKGLTILPPKTQGGAALALGWIVAGRLALFAGASRRSDSPTIGGLADDGREIGIALCRAGEGSGDDLADERWPARVARRGESAERLAYYRSR